MKYLKDNPQRRTCIKLCDAFYEFGLECFIVEEIEMIIIKNKGELFDRETYYQKLYNSVDNGYNTQYAKSS